MEMSMSTFKNNEERNDLYVAKLERELDRALQLRKFDEICWNEKENSLSAIIDEQKKVISLLESVLKSSQQQLDTMHESFRQKNADINLITKDIQQSFEQTNEQVDLLKATIKKVEQQLAAKESDLRANKEQVLYLKDQLESKEASLKKLILENESVLKQLSESNDSKMELSGQNSVLKERATLYFADIQQMQSKIESAENIISDLNSEKERLQKMFLQEKQKFGQRIDSLQEEIRRRSKLADQDNNNLTRLIELEGKKSLSLAQQNDCLTADLHLRNIKIGELEKAQTAQGKQLESLQRELTEVEQKRQKLQTNITGLLAREVKYRKSIDELQQKIAEEKEKAYEMISYKLGYALIQAGKSWGAFFGLPKTLLNIHNDAKQRRIDRNAHKSAKSLPLLHQQRNGDTRKVKYLEEAIRPTDDNTYKKIKIAGVMDEFTFHSYSPEAEILQLHPENWQKQLEEFKPDLLFIESAWQGLDGLWKTKISNAKEEIIGALKWCNAHKTPTMFWNKEDPVHFGTFLPIASLVDFIFTTDIDCIPKYKSKIGHDNVYLLPFAAQPKIHNPVEKFQRKDAFNFAGSYYLRYPERQRDFAALLDTVEQFKNVEVYDRNFDNPHPHYTFPDKYKRFILGKLPFSEIDKAYKGYRYGINMNTIKQSQTMFARRVFELLASNTVVVSNFSRGVRLLFGDLVISSDSVTQLKSQLKQFCEDETDYRKLRLLGLRKVLSEHTYAHRLAYITSKLSGQAYKDSRSDIYVIARVSNIADFEKIQSNFDRQMYEKKYLIVLTSNDQLRFEVDKADRQLFLNREDFFSYINELNTHVFFSVFSVFDYYAANFLVDLELSVSYSNALVFGKGAYYMHESGGIKLCNDGEQYRAIDSLNARASIIRKSGITAEKADVLFENPEGISWQNLEMFAVDEFNYCRGGGANLDDDMAKVVSDIRVTDQGISYINQLIAVSESLQPLSEEFVVPATTQEPGLTAQRLFELIPEPSSSAIQFSMQGGKFKIVSKLPANKHAYVYTKQNFRRDELNLLLNSEFKLHCDGPLTVMTVFEFQDSEGIKISHSMNKVGDTHALAIPEHCVYVRFGLKLQANGYISIDKLAIGGKSERPFAVIGKSNRLVISKQYPSYDDLYKYGFVHSRIRAYKGAGTITDVFRLTKEDVNYYREFEGIDVAAGDHALLNSTVATGQFKTIFIHILDNQMWDVVKRYLNRVKIVVWVHGSEIQHWKRRAFEFDNMSSADINRQKKLSDNRMKFWREIFSRSEPNLHFVFVSQWLVDSTEEDLGIKIPKESYTVIGNYIDNTIFNYSPKSAQDRFKLLSIRPYEKRVYANDLTVAAIIELSKRPFFNELQFTLIGDGALFDETVKPLVNLPNVEIIKRFLTHPEIAEFHKKNGIFLVPTRMDTQGVSRDEAMSSGLVPITTRVAAIPEFVDENCGVIVAPEAHTAIADAVEDLFKDQDRFLLLSANASQRVSLQSNFDSTIRKEISLGQ